ncbi:pilus assembly protein PilX [Geobacter anodireducens]|uniref:Pilus assembly protein PilX n=1 Tax=Geobacter anodireducens TaxID=1340425 RepID=A0ABR9NRE6_9BACT|nr:pilus assembly protein PilX [Geobacter anodireducens]MBE2886819.1 pilus assembly protein PilX [Geobacter anodireducens]
MKILDNERGVALVTSLLLTLISLGVVLTLLYLVLQGTKMSAARKTYANSLEASYGGVEVVTKEVIPYLFANISSSTKMTDLQSSFGGNSLTFYVSDACIKQKLALPAELWSACSDAQKSQSTDTIKSAPDLGFKLRGTSGKAGFNVYSKIVDTSPGNSDPSSQTSGEAEWFLAASGAAYNPVVAGSGGVKVKHIPGVYKLEVQGERETSSQEKATLSVLYAY